MWKRAWQDTQVSFGFHRRQAAFRNIILTVVALLIVRFLGGKTQMSEESKWVLSSIIAIVIVFVFTFLFHLARAPIFIKWEKEKRLIIKNAEIHKQGNTSDAHWLRLRVENPSILPISNCYGKLLNRRLVGGIDSDGQLIEVTPTFGQTSSHTRELPPEGHKFPWSTCNTPDTEVVVSGYDGFEYLYLVTKNNNSSCFYIPSGLGLMYSNWISGIFEFDIEVGSETETFRPTKARIKFKAVGTLEFVSLNIID